MSELGQDDFRYYLLRSFSERRARRSRYSQRAFARDLGISPQHLSRLLKGDLGLSAKLAINLAARMGLSSAEADEFVALVDAFHSRSPLVRIEGQERLLKIRSSSASQAISEKISSGKLDAKSLAVLMLLSLKNENCAIENISRRLNLSDDEVRSSIAQLLVEGLIRAGEDGSWDTHLSYIHFSSNGRTGLSKLSSLPIQDSLSEDSGATVVDYISLSADQINEIKRKINEFCFRFAREVSSKEGAGKRIHILSVQLFPIDRGVN